MSTMSLAELIAHVGDDTDEYISKKGHVSCEFSSGMERLEELRPILTANTARLKEAGFASRWIVYECPTCRGYHEDKPLHVSIESYQFAAENHVRHLHEEAP